MGEPTSDFLHRKTTERRSLGMNPESNHGTPNPDELMNQMDANNDGKLSSREMNGPL
ncbi:MAG: hypothetical protein P8H56_02445 [Crocinitomicaceae bacterium]|nr:hypothetical protein [Crocinitomicaceae bacterium]MDG1657423.1 hypothetical protein [Crocinitomicaceae bacterium]|tara:strand:+ start:10762 stop:10932 length:171 start_codon:yes stop_codon:yes gene_type:complete